MDGPESKREAMNNRYVVWLLVGLALTLTGLACVGEVSQDSKLTERAVAKVNPGSIGEADAGQPDFCGEPTIHGLLGKQAAPNGGATVYYKTCSDMYFTCQEMGGFCTKKYPGCDTWGQSACGTCYENCQAGTRYPKKCKCGKCGFTE